MISGANDVELTVANDRADLLLEIQDLKQKLAVVNEMNVANYNKYCEVLSILAQFEGWLTAQEQIIDDSKQKPVFRYVLNKLKELKGGIKYE